MSVVAEALREVSYGPTEDHQGLGVIPLLRDERVAPTYLTLGDALAAGAVEIAEVSEEGSVPTLVARNRGDQPVLILDGEELVGAKQNRVANSTMLLPAQATIPIPVSCVEQGRWSWRSREFGVSRQTLHATGRRRNIQQVTQSLREGRSYRGDQGALWQEVAEKSRRMRVRSPTGALGDVYLRHDPALDRIQQLIRPAHHQVGAVFLIGRRPAGLELVAHPAIWRRIQAKVVRGYAVDALEGEPPPDAVAEREVADRFLASVAAAAETRFAGVGLGETLRLESSEVVGAGLVDAGALLHLAAFPRDT